MTRGTGTDGEYGFVYVFFNGEKDPQKTEPLYVGSTRHIANRLKQHLTGTALGITPEQRNEVEVIAVGVTTEFLCREVEAYLIGKWKPKFNTVIPSRPNSGYADYCMMEFSYFTKDDFLKDNTICYECFDRQWEKAINTRTKELVKENKRLRKEINALNELNNRLLEEVDA